MEPWRLIDTGVRTAAENMALDWAILEARCRDLVPNTVRFLQFSPPAVLVGYHQSVAQEVRTDYCRRSGIDINRRITGGGTIYFDATQLGWEVVGSTDGSAPWGSRALLFSTLSEAVVKGLRRVGLQAAFRPRNDIEVDGRKISGTGGTEGDGAFLFQGTLLLDFDVDTMLRSLRVPVEKLVDKEIRSLRDRVTWVRRELGYLPPLAEVKAALREGFEEVLGVRLLEGALTLAEEDLFRDKHSYFESSEWVNNVSSPQEQEVLRSIYKAPGGLLRVALIVDTPANRIKSAIITGDFFAYPARCILDLVNALKDEPAEAEAIEKTVKSFFRDRQVYIAGVDEQHVTQALKEAVERGGYGRWGIGAQEASGVFTVGKTLPELPRPSVLLLPYCAKLVDCAQRYEDGCSQCGLCTVGDAYQLAEEKGLRPISIVNYEHLQETLVRCREQGIEGFVGTCCEAFYAKHRDDFEASGLPGVLVDIDSTTCYDLGEESLAYRGAFERQTNLRMDLLRKVVEAVVEGK